MRRRPAQSGRRAAPSLTILAAGIVAVALALAGDVFDILAAQEQDTVALRYQLRGEQPVSGVAVVEIDDASISQLGVQWPFPRSLHARAIDRLRAAGARVVVYDVQFTEQTRPREDLALFDAVRRAPGTVLVTSETDGRGGHEILGGPANLRARAGRRRRGQPRDRARRRAAALPRRRERAPDGGRARGPARRARRRARSRRTVPGSTSAGRPARSRRSRSPT